MKSRITFNGMNRYSPPNSAQPGDCTAIVNLRNQSNCLKPVGTPEYLYTPEKKNHWLVYVHICYDGEHHITENENTLYSDKKRKRKYPKRIKPVVRAKRPTSSVYSIHRKHTHNHLYRKYILFTL